MLATSAYEVLQGQLLSDFGVSLALQNNALKVGGTSALTACLGLSFRYLHETLQASFADRRIAHRL